MTQAFFDMLYLFSCAAHGKTPAVAETLDVNKVIGAASRQGVLPLVLKSVIDSHNAGGIQIQNQVLESFIRDLRVKIAYNMQRAIIADRVIKHLEDCGITCCVLKGDTVASLYKNPECRISNDVDLYINTNDKKTMKNAIRILKGHGYEFQGDPPNSHHFTGSHKIAGSIELHSNLFKDQYIDVWFDNKTLLSDPYRMVTTPYGNELPTLGINDGLVYMFLHIVKHFVNAGIGIKPIMDTLLYIRKYKDEIDYTSFSELIRYLKYDRFFDCMLCIGTKYLGFAENDLYPFTFDEVIAEKVLTDIEIGGSFGNAEVWRVGFYVTYNRARFNRFKGEVYDEYMKKWKVAPFRKLFLHRSEMIFRLPYVSKSMFLLPIAWVHRAVLFVFESLTGKRTGNVDNTNIEERMDLIRELDMV